ncbi:MAG: amino acid adenylation domain-containing protein [Bacteroidota bacterium]
MASDPSPVPVDAARTLCDVVAQHALTHPQHPALRDATTTWAYADLQAAMDRVAVGLQARQRPTGPVALLLTPGVANYGALMGVMQAGFIALPLDPNHPPAYLAQLLHSAAPVALLSDRASAPLIAQLKAEAAVPPTHVVLDDLLTRPLAPAEVAAARPVLDPTSPALILYTSGSTGTPKGVVHSHQAFLQSGVHRTAYAQLKPADRVTMLYPYTSSAGVKVDAVSALYAGATLCLYDLKAQGLARLKDWLRREGITVYHSVPTVFRALCQTLAAEDRFPEVRFVHLGGEPWRWTDVDLFAQHFEPSCRLTNNFGATEAGIVCRQAIDPAAPRPPGPVPVGQPPPFNTVKLVDEAGDDVPYGETGRITVRSPHVALGYWRAPALTAKTFIDHGDGTRTYRSGDLGRWTDHGLELLGRADSIVKVRGIRVNPVEVERALLGDAQVADAVVHPDPEQLRALVVVSGSEPLDRGRLRQALRDRLPSGLVLSQIVAVDALPRLPNGKVNRQDLGRLLDQAAISEPIEAPQTPTEVALAAIWAEVLEIDQVGQRTHFFERGGQSIRALHVAAQVEEELGIHLPPATLFDHPVLADLAAFLDTQAQAAEVQTLPVAPRPPETPFEAPTTTTQQRLWFLHQLAPDDTAYHNGAAWQLRGPLDEAALEASCRALVDRHEPLRTTLGPTADGPPRQWVHPHRPCAFTREEAEPLDDEGLQARLTALTQEPYALTQGPLHRFVLLRRGPEDHVLFLGTHHIISDGWSMGVLYRELSALYAFHRTGAPLALPPLSAQYADWAQWQQDHPVADGDPHLSYWRDQLRDLPPLDWPLERPRPPARTGQGGTVPFTLPASVHRVLEALGAREDASLFMVLLTAFQVVLARYTRQNDFAVAVPVAGRPHPALRSLFGFFANTLLIRTPGAWLPTEDGHEAPSFRSALRQVRQTTLAGYAHQEAPFDRVVEGLRSRRAAGEAPLAQVFFALQNAYAEALALPDLHLHRLPLEPGSAKADLTAELRTDPATGALTGTFTYDADLFTAARVEPLVTAYQRLLTAVAEAPDTPIDRIPLASWPSAGPPVTTPTATVWTRFAAQAKARPNAVALLHHETTWTYADVRAEADRIAAHLQATGLHPGAHVGLLLERGPALVAALLAVLRLGGVYVPLDPANPPARTRFVMDDADVAALVTTATLDDGYRPSGPVLHVEALPDHVPDGPLPPPPDDPEQPAYLMYTSGSTGTPKGTLVPHRAILPLVLDASYVTLRPGDRVAHLSNTAFDAATFEIWGALLNGATLVIYDTEVVQNPEALAASFQAAPPTVVFLTTRLFDLLAHQAPEALGAIEQVYFGGEAANAEAVRALVSTHPPGALYNMYGPTETTTFATAYRIPIPLVAHGPSLPIGRPLGHVRAQVLDDHGQPVVPGGLGELVVGGAGVALGYWQRPTLTAERFRPDPQGPPGAQQYRTGDLVWQRPDGLFVYAGRRDQQLKIRGFRVEPGEVEAALCTHPSVEAAAVVPHAHQGTLRLIAYVTTVRTRPGGPAESVSLGALRTHLADRLPAYLMPTQVEFLEALPLTANGKLDTAALPAPTAVRQTDEATFVPPLDPLSLRLVAVWEDVLDVRPISMTDAFFDLGGHSLLAVSLFARLEAAFGVALPLATLFDHPTPASLADRLRTVLRDDAPTTSDGAVLIQAGSPRPPLFCIHGAGGNVIKFYKLARYLGPQQTVYGLEARGLDGRQRPQDDIAAMARAYHEALEAVYPTGPCYLCGFSVGGLIAYELAQQLAAAGRTVAFLGLIDTVNPAVRHAGLLAETGRARLGVRRVRQTLHDRRLWREAEAFVARGETVPRDLRERWMRRAHRRAMDRYTPRPYAGPVTFFAATPPDKPAAHHEAGWQPLAQGLWHVHPVPGTHSLIREPFVQHLAEAMIPYLEMP